MTEIPGVSSATFREWRWLIVPVVIWLVLSVLTAMAGPFETYRLLEPMPRMAYWAAVVGVSVLVDAGYRWLFRNRPMLQRVGGRLGFALVLSALVHGLNMVVFPGWMGLSAWLWLVGIVWVIAIAIEGLVALSRMVHLSDIAHQSEGELAEERPSASDVFQRRMSFEKRGNLVRLEAQDHYLKVVTDVGEDLILLRLGDAAAELSDFDGLRVHRSHWVARDQVAQVLRRDGRLFLIMSDGTEVPVSRTYKPVADAAGLTP